MKNKIDFNELKSQKKEIYESLWKNCDFDFEVAKKGVKDPSYEIAFSDKTLIDFVGDKIALSFDINKNKDTFAKKFQMACSGSGDELKKITTLHSSSLCALLFFFNVDNKKLVIPIPSLSEYEFTEAYFEFKNKVIRSPSNIDVVLLGKNIKTGKKVILFLESKFSEYITGTGKIEVSKSYFKSGCYSAPIYESIEKEESFNFNKKDGFYNSKKYNEGIKQMISHYYGIRNFMKKPTDNEDVYKNIREYGADEIILGEILFDNFAKNIGLTEKLNNYKDDYSKLAEIINKEYKKDEKKPENIKFKVLEKALSYSELEEYISDFPKIKKFYFGNK